MTARWGEITAEEILSPIRGELLRGSPGSIFSGLSTDSREVNPGELFWALKGEKYDGHDFIDKALDKGAAGLVVEKGLQLEPTTSRDFALIAVADSLKALGDLAGWWRHQYPIPVAVITGSAGKTTTKEMAAGILGLGGETLKNKGNFNNLIGLPLTLLSLERAHGRAVLEMGMNRPGEIGRLTEVADPDVGLITNVGKAHLEGLGSLEGIAGAKAEMLEKISADAQVILNGDDELLMRVAAAFPGKLITYGLGKENHMRAEKIRDLGRRGTSFELRYFGGAIPIGLRVPGLQNVFNALAASAIAICLEEPPENIVEGLRRFEGMKGRFMISTLPGGAVLVDDSYNSNPFSLRAATDTLKGLVGVGGRIIVCLGEMLELGDEAAEAHFEAGSMAGEVGASYFLALGEHAGEMVKGAISRGLPPHRALALSNPKEMEEKMREVMRSGDIILLKGSRKMGLEKIAESLMTKHEGRVKTRCKA